jgi:lipopolysaccharide biosynthesis regulator YciM
MSIEVFNYAYAVMFNKARLLGNLADMEKAVELLENDSNDNREFLKSTYDDLLEHYIARGMTTKLIKLLNRVTNKDI